MNTAFKSFCTQIEVAIPSLRLTISSIFAGKITSQDLLIEVDDAGRKTNTGRQCHSQKPAPTLPSGWFLHFQRLQVHNGKDAIHLSACAVTGLNVIVMFDNVSPLSDAYKFRIMSTSHMRSGDTNELVQNLITCQSSVPITRNESRVLDVIADVPIGIQGESLSKKKDNKRDCSGRLHNCNHAENEFENLLKWSLLSAFERANSGFSISSFFPSVISFCQL